MEKEAKSVKSETKEQLNENPAMWWVDSTASIEVVLWTKELF